MPQLAGVEKDLHRILPQELMIATTCLSKKANRKAAEILSFLQNMNKSTGAMLQAFMVQ